MADNQEPEPILLHEDTHKKDLISILGTQGLMYNDFNAAEYKLLMLIIKHNQKVIKQYIVPANLQHGHLPFTKEQFQAGHVDIVIPFKEFGYNRSNNLWLKDKLCQMAKKPIAIPYKMNDTTYYRGEDRHRPEPAHAHRLRGRVARLVLAQRLLHRPADTAQQADEQGCLYRGRTEGFLP